MKLCSIASGSSGNCIYIGSQTTGLLVDTGISKKRIEQGLLEIAVDPEGLQGILITHEHSDHIQGLGVMSRKYHLPIFGTKGTIEAIKATRSLGQIEESLYHVINKDETFAVGDMEIHAISTSHDAADPVAYQFQCDGKRGAVITDLGTYDEHIIDSLQQLDLLLLEANHDVRMLQVGSYPYYLKQRILGNRGHLSNDSSAQLLCELIHGKMKHVLLGHLSKENNMEELAYETVRQEVEQAADGCGCSQLHIGIARRDCPSDMLEV